MTQTNRSTTVVVIPTRNRADLAINAIKSALQGLAADADVILLVSDNSTSEEDRKTLAGYCESLGDQRLILVTPPSPVSMTAHWEWAINHVLHHTSGTHFLYLTDRSRFKPGGLGRIIDAARQYPDRVISYDWVTIFDHLSPIAVEPQLHTGQFLQITSTRLLSLSSQSIFPHCLPRMMNSCVPRSVLENMLSRFGSVFASTSPDYNFCYRCLQIVDHIIYYDYAAFISYSILRSNGAGAMGIQTAAVLDFGANLELGGRLRNYGAPLPAIETLTNCIIHEYCLVQRETVSQTFPDVRLTQYLVAIAKELFVTLVHKLPTPVWRYMANLRNRVSDLFRRPLSSNNEGQSRPVFKTLDDAVEYAISVSPNPTGSRRHLDLLWK